MLGYHALQYRKMGEPDSRKAFLTYEGTWALSDLNRAIDAAESCFEAPDTPTSVKTRMLADLATYLRLRYFRSDYNVEATEDKSDLTRAVAKARAALARTGPRDRNRATYLCILAEVLMLQWDEVEEHTPAQLREVVDTSRQAVEMVRPRVVYRHNLQLAQALQRQGRAFAEARYCRESIEEARKALEALNGDERHPKLGLVFIVMAECYCNSFEVLGRPDDRSTALQCAAEAVKSTPLDCPDRDWVFLTWARIQDGLARQK